MVDEFRALKNLVLLLKENDNSSVQEEESESVEAIGLRIQTAQYQNELKSLGTAVKKKSTQFPSLHTNSNIWTFLTQTIKEIECSVSMKLGSHNLSYAHKIALDNLSKLSHLVIKPSDKGGSSG